MAQGGFGNPVGATIIWISRDSLPIAQVQHHQQHDDATHDGQQSLHPLHTRRSQNHHGSLGAIGGRGEGT